MCASPCAHLFIFFPEALALIAMIEGLDCQAKPRNSIVHIWLVMWQIPNITHQPMPVAMSVLLSRNICSRSLA